MKRCNAFGKIIVFIPVLLFIASCAKSYTHAPGAVVLEKAGRFVAYSDGTVRDTRHRLMWPSVAFHRYMAGSEVEAFCKAYRGGGYTDWRIPSLRELQTLYAPVHVNAAGLHGNRLIRISGNVWASDVRVLIINRPDRYEVLEVTLQTGYMDFKTGKTGFIYSHQKITGFEILPVRRAD